MIIKELKALKIPKYYIAKNLGVSWQSVYRWMNLGYEPSKKNIEKIKRFIKNELKL